VWVRRGKGKGMATIIGVPKEIKDMEGRVSMQPDGVAELVHHGHEVYVQAGAGEGAGFSDEEYEEAGGRVVEEPEEVFEASDLIVKVKEPVPEEYDRFREGQQLFTYLHLAADKGLTEFLMERKINSIAYETVESSDGSLPLLTPMSEVAGRMSIQAAAHHLESPQGGAGLLLGGVPGTPAAKVTIIGGGVVGTEAAKIALGMRALVSVLDISPKRLAYLSDIFEGRADLVIPNRARTAAYVRQADVVVGAVLVHGAKAPKLVTREMVASMRPGSVVADVAIDQGGCIETARPTTHSHPTYVEEGVVHYCVANIPGAVARTSTLALTSATLPYLIRIADKGIEGAATEDESLAKGLSTLGGDLVSAPVAEAHDLSYTDAEKLLS
ncbi:MAG TPA: alanine dehydrogenase, partial [Rubrobacter sp.]|nr:alanine dehydrogenase [Rubrobacter sp.]